MLKPTGNFKLSKQTKRFMATYTDPVQRNSFKRDMIQAELHAMIQPPRKEKRTYTQASGGDAGDLTS
jgi:hypothetical protein